jgi:hypothetical protein
MVLAFYDRWNGGRRVLSFSHFATPRIQCKVGRAHCPSRRIIGSMDGIGSRSYSRARGAGAHENDNVAKDCALVLGFGWCSPML